MSLTLVLEMNQALQNYFVDNDIQAKDLHVCTDHSVIPPAVKTPDCNFARIKKSEAKTSVLNLPAVKTPTLIVVLLNLAKE